MLSKGLMAMRNKVVAKAKSYLGCKESDGSHKKIIDLYNSHKPLARGYKVKYTDEWCATFVSAVSIACGLTDIMPTECSCSKMIELYKKNGGWKESDSYVPSPGDLIMYDWEDSGRGDNTGLPNHVGIVAAVNGTSLTVIEGNKGEAVAYRAMTVNGKYIRGYCVPNYARNAPTAAVTTVSVKVPSLKKNATGGSVRALQAVLSAKGHSTAVDGSFGPATEKSVKAYQKANGLTADGICGQQTWTSLLN
jgi:hypothetical protein